jgi:diguanylate cyclase (GGDEF)-like protein
MSAKILLVEDNKAQAKVIMDYLQESGYEVKWVMDGKSAIKTATKNEHDVVLLDLILPDMSGTQICRWLRQNQDTRGLPIIMLTAKDSLSEKVSGLEAGADDYLLKPYKESELNARIYTCLRTKALRDELSLKNRQLENLLQEVKKLAIMDHLTELYNRRYFETVLTREFKKLLRYGFSLSCILLDIDHFKKVNDDYGHRVGDSVLKEVAGILLQSVRDVDTVARWGGEEFIVLLPQSSSEDAQHVASRMLMAISEHKFLELPDRKITVSIGMANASDPSMDSAEQIISTADSAMYRAKSKGRNRIEID